MKTKKLLLSLFSAAIVALFVGCVAPDNTTKPQEAAFTLSQEATSTTSVTIAWPADTGNAIDYTVRVYKDVNLAEQVHEFKYSVENTNQHRFTVPFLDCDNTFYIEVVDSENGKSAPLEISLDDGILRRNILTQNFDKLCWGYDYMNSAAGIRLNSDVENKLSYSLGSLAESNEDCHLVTKAGDEGGLLLGWSAGIKKLLDITDWNGTKANVYIRPGYVKLGNAYSSNSELSSPKFTALTEGEKVSADISFSLCAYSAEIDGSTVNATASIVKGDGTVLWSESIFVEAVTDTPKWKNIAYTVDNITSDCYFKIVADKQLCFDNLKIVRRLDLPKDYIYGYLYDKDTNEAIEGVAVSDGFQVVLTDNEGFYSMKPNIDSWYIFYSLPSEYKVTIGGNGLPKFFSLRESGVKEYNFALRKIEGGAEKKFALFAFADPQVSSKAKLSRFTKEAVPAIGQYVKSMDCPCYGITLGDIISNSSGSNSEAFRDQMRDAMHYNKIKLPVYQVMGNHDANYYDEISPVEPDNNSSTYNIKAQRAFEVTNGPINFSFNRGNVHIVGMRDIVYNSTTSMAKYTGGFLDSQYEWLKQDLAVVPKDMTVVLCVHIPLHYYRVIGSVNHIGDVHQLLNQFKEAHILSGHTHYNLNKEPSSTFPNVYEHNVGTVCGTWWTSNLCGDGTPNGYGVFICEGSGFSNWYYMGYNEGMNSRDYQLRIYRGNAITGAAKDDNQNGVEGYYSFNFGDDQILANVFNADSKWKIEVYEDGVYTGKMKLISDTSASYSKELVGSYTYDDPRRIKDGVKAGNDMWVVGIHMGVLDRYNKTDKEPSNGSWTANTHMYLYTLKNKDAKVKVVATDRFGTKYEVDKFTDYHDNKLGMKP